MRAGGEALALGTAGGAGSKAGPRSSSGKMPVVAKTPNGLMIQTESHGWVPVEPTKNGGYRPLVPLPGSGQGFSQAAGGAGAGGRPGGGGRQVPGVPAPPSAAALQRFEDSVSLVNSFTDAQIKAHMASLRSGGGFWTPTKLKLKVRSRTSTEHAVPLFVSPCVPRFHDAPAYLDAAHYVLLSHALSPPFPLGSPPRGKTAEIGVWMDL